MVSRTIEKMKKAKRSLKEINVCRWVTAQFHGKSAVFQPHKCVFSCLPHDFAKFKEEQPFFLLKDTAVPL